MKLFAANRNSTTMITRSITGQHRLDEFLHHEGIAGRGQGMSPPFQPGGHMVQLKAKGFGAGIFDFREFLLPFAAVAGLEKKPIMQAMAPPGAPYGHFHPVRPRSAAGAEHRDRNIVAVQGGRNMGFA